MSLSKAHKMLIFMDIKQIQEAYDLCNFTEEQKKLFPRPETEEDVEKFNKTIFDLNPKGNFDWSHGLLCFLLSILFCPMYGGWGYQDRMLKEDENKKIDE